MKRASCSYEVFLPSPHLNPKPSFEVLIPLNAIPEVPRRPIQELIQVFFPWDQARTGPQVMSTSKAVPEGLKNQECEKGNRKKRPPIHLGCQLLSNYLVIPVVTVFCSQILVTLLTFDTVTGKISESKWKVTSK